MLVIKNLSYAYPNGTAIFEGLNVRFASSSLQVISGDNGTGKTTLLKLMAGLLGSEKGIFQNKIMGSTGYIGSSLSHLPDLTILEYISYLYTLNFSQTNNIKGLLKTALEALALKISIHTSLRTLSSGQAQKIQLARLWTEPHALWLIDEPFAHCDAHSKSAFVQKCDQVRAQGALIILTEHDLKPFEGVDFENLHL